MWYVVGLIVFALGLIFFLCAFFDVYSWGEMSWRIVFIRFGTVMAIIAGVILFLWLANGSVNYLIGRGK